MCLAYDMFTIPARWVDDGNVRVDKVNKLDHGKDVELRLADKYDLRGT